MLYRTENATIRGQEPAEFSQNLIKSILQRKQRATQIYVLIILLFLSFLKAEYA